jgi:hypothetical protein
MQPASSASLEAQWPDLVAAISAAIDLEATARTSGALVRRREIRTAEALLRLALAYGPGGLSLRAAAAWAEVSGLADLSDTALMNRLRKAAAWLGAIAGALLRGAAAAASTTLDGPLPGRRLRIADASMITGPGGTPKWRLHAAYDPVAGRFTDLVLTDERGAEGFGRTAWQVGDVALGRGWRPLLRPPAPPRRCGRSWRAGPTSSSGPAGPGGGYSTRMGRRWRGSGSSATWPPARSPSGRSRWTTPGRAASRAATPCSRRASSSFASHRRRRHGRPRRSTGARTGAARIGRCNR